MAVAGMRIPASWNRGVPAGPHRQRLLAAVNSDHLSCDSVTSPEGVGSDGRKMMSQSRTTHGEETANPALSLAEPEAREDVPHGASHAVHCQRLSGHGLKVVGAVTSIGASSGASGTETRALKRASRTFGWESLRESELGMADLVAHGLTNREIGARACSSRGTPWTLTCVTSPASSGSTRGSN